MIMWSKIDWACPFGTGLRAKNVQRVGVHFHVCSGLEREQTHLRAVAVCQHQVVVRGHARQLDGCASDVVQLIFGRGRLVAPQQRVAAQCHNQLHFGLSARRTCVFHKR